ncbi:MAG: hypothetical protein HY939_00255 [Gammaproteobacteria bacterium]|nr:hypothetical protein [Gammaproteobacteria bacterium]
MCHPDKQANALWSWVNGLYECCRGGNINEDSIDDHQFPNRPICASGHFNKLLESLHGVHTLVDIIFINKVSTSLALRSRLQTSTRAYFLNLLDQASSIEQLDEAMDLFRRLQAYDPTSKDGPEQPSAISAAEIVWHAVNPGLAVSMMEDYGIFFNNDPADKNYVEFFGDEINAVWRHAISLTDTHEALVSQRYQERQHTLSVEPAAETLTPRR